MTVDQLQRWVQRKYGRALTDEELAQLADVVGYTGGPISEDMFRNAQGLVDEAASSANIPVVGEPGQITSPVEPGSGRVEGTPSETVDVPAGPATPRTGGGTPAEDMDVAAAIADIKAWASSLGYTLNDAQIGQIATAIGFTGNRVSAQQLQAAKDWATANVATLFPGGAGGGTTGGTTGSASGGTTGGSMPGSTPGSAVGTPPSTTPAPTAPPQIQNLDTETVNLLKGWWRKTFMTDPTDAQLGEIARRVNYTGGPITPQQYAQIQGAAETLMREGGWKPPEEPTFENYLPTFSYEDFQFGEQAPAGYQAGPAFTPQAFAYGEQGPAAFDYAEFVAPGQEDVLRDPAYQRRLAEGQKALETSAAAKGLLRTGATLKGLSEYAQQQASDEYARAYQRQLGEYQMGRAGAKDEYEAGRQAYMDRYNKAYQEYLTNLENQKFAYSTGEQQRRSAYDEAQREYDRKYGMARDKYQTGYNKAFAEYQSKRSAAERQYEQDWNYWKYLQDDARERAKFAMNLSS
jgi:hypothetical protein